MESHIVVDTPNSRLQPHFQSDLGSQTQANDTGAYGLSVQVQGIDGHPFIILNNQDTDFLSDQGPDRDIDGSFLDNYHEYDFHGDSWALSNDPFVVFRSQKQMWFGGPHNGAVGDLEGPLLNFQRHPELLRPYYPERDMLSLREELYECFLPRASSPLVSPAPSPGTPEPQPAGQVRVWPAMGDRIKPSAKPPFRPPSGNASPSSELYAPPMRRYDSSSPVLQSYPSKALCQDLYADAINRHQNRRYIPFLPGTGRDIDTGPTLAVDQLIDRFDVRDGHQQRGRAGWRNRNHLEECVRSRSLDSGLPSGLQRDVAQGSTEHLLREQMLVPEHGPLVVNVLAGPLPGVRVPSLQPDIASMETATIQRVISSSSTTLSESNVDQAEKSLRSVKVLMSAVTVPLSEGQTSMEIVARATPDLLKGQQELSQQTHEETAKQILFNYLKDGSVDNDDATKRKVNLVFEKIQTLKSRAAGKVQEDSNAPHTAAEVTELRGWKCDLEKTVTDLKRQLKEETERHQSLAEAHEKALVHGAKFQEELTRSREESARLQEKLSWAETQLQSNLIELLQVKMEQEQCKTEIGDLQDQLSEMHDELDGTMRATSDNAEREAVLQDAAQLKLDLEEVLLTQEEQKEVLRRRERELTALKGVLKEEVATHDQEVDILRTHYEQEIHKLQQSVQEAKESSMGAGQEKLEAETALKKAKLREGHLSLECDQLHRQIQQLENEAAELRRAVDQAQLKESQLSLCVGRHEKEKQLMQVALAEVKQREEEMSRANIVLTTRLEDVQRKVTQMTEGHRRLTEILDDERRHKQEVEKTKNQIEEERRLLDVTVDKLQKEMCEKVESYQTSNQELQEQINEHKDKSRKDLAELQRRFREKSMEVEKSHLVAVTLQEKLADVEAELKRCKVEQEGAELKVQSLEQRVSDLQAEVEARSQSKDERSRQIRLMEARMSQLELDLDEERSCGDLLMDRIDRGREQLEQIRTELQQERAARQDLECDKIALERQNKDLKSRVAHLEGSHRANQEGLVSQLEGRLQELEQRLEGEERDRANLQLANRRLERKVKEMTMQVDDERHSLQDQKDQLNLRLKALKRQLDEAEEEIERLAHGKKKLQRDLEEQLETNEQLQRTLRSETRRKSAPAPIQDDQDDDDDDDISTEGEIYYSPSSEYRRSFQAARV